MPAHPPSAGRPPLSLQLRGASASRRGLRFPPFLSALDCHWHPLREGAAVVAARSRSPKPQPEAAARSRSPKRTRGISRKRSGHTHCAKARSWSQPEAQARGRSRQRSPTARLFPQSSRPAFVHRPRSSWLLLARPFPAVSIGADQRVPLTASRSLALAGPPLAPRLCGGRGVDLPKDGGVGQKGVDSEGGEHRWPARPTPASSR